MRKEKIVYLALGYPDVAAATNIYTDLMSEFVKQGHEVLIVAPAKKPDKIGLQIEGGTTVLRVLTLPLFNVGAIKKGIANLMLPYQYKKAIKKYGIEWDFDFILLATPPITLFSIAEWMKIKSGANIYLILRDIFPQNAVDLKMLKKNGFIYNYFRKQEKKLYNVADSIGCMSKANVEYIKAHNPELNTGKLHLLPNWEYIPEHVNPDEIVETREKYDLKNKFILLFGGNIGKPQKLENIISLAESCQDMEDVLFFIIGSGTEKKKIQNLSASLELSNVTIKENVSKKDYINILASADVGLISLSEEFTIPNFPSKVLSYFGLKKPILASLDLATDFGHMLEETNSGLWAKAGDTLALKAKLIELYESKEKRKVMGENGYKHMEKYLTPEIACNTIISNLKK